MKSFLIICLFAVFIFFASQSFAESSYVLPYPSAMPGSVLYKFGLVREALMKYWYFGDFGEFNYNLSQSDKYLVEVKTLFDYKQYLLGYQALFTSNGYFEKIKPNLVSAEKHGKNVSNKMNLLKEAARKHIEELAKLKETVPENFSWQPEKQKSTNLHLWESIDRSIGIREEIL